MEVKAVSKYVKVQPRKVRIIADEVRGMNAAYAAQKLRYHTSKSAHMLHKTLVSAMANAVENNNLEASTLKIAAIWVDQGPVQKRMRARAQGRGNRILKKTSHITVVVEDAEATPVVKAHGTRPKARPTLAAKPARGAKPTAATAAPKTNRAAASNDEPATDVATDSIVPTGAQETPVESAATEPATEAAAIPAETPAPTDVVEGGGEAAGADAPVESTSTDAPSEEQK